MKLFRSILASIVILLTVSLAYAQDDAQSGDAVAEMARKLQNPLANIKAIMTDNNIGFDTGTDDGVSYGFQIQPVYAIDFEKAGFTFIPRAVIPIVGLEPGTKVPQVGGDGNPTPAGTKDVWGISDIALQFFFAPHTESGFKWGFGPAVSLSTHSQPELAGPKWGAGFVGIISTALSPDISFAAILGNHWGFDGSFNTANIQPMVFYNINSLPGAFLAYNAPITADWEADSNNRWIVPLGLTAGKTFDAGGGNGFDFMIGPYFNVARPDGAAKWQIRFGLTWLFP